MTTGRWLILGAGGQLATHLIDVLAGADVVAVTHRQLDITDAGAVTEAVHQIGADVVVNCAAYTAVDAAESDSATAFAVNADGAGNVAAAVSRAGGRLIHISTDYVFAGNADRPYEPDDPTEPRTVYGRSKLAGERAVLSALPSATILRTAWLFGGPGRNFVDTMLELARTDRTVDVVRDQIGSPTWARDLAQAVVAAAGSSATQGRILHFVNAGAVSWCEFAREVFRLAGAVPERVRPVTSAEFVRPAPRPAWSVLSTRAWTNLAFPAPRPWQIALQDCVSTRTA